jgi:TIR domain
MPQVFISYAHVSPDKKLAAELASFLDTNGFAVFVDSKIRLGQDWVEQIDIQLRSSEYFIVLLSPAAVQSDMVRREIAIAYKLRKANKLTIFPIRIGFDSELPYDIGAYLDVIQYTMWRPGDSSDAVCHTILEALRSYSSAVANRSESPNPTTVTRAAPVLDPHRFDKLELDRLGRELARYLGPVARVIMDRAARHAANWGQLHELLAMEIPAGEERTKFLATCRR